MKTKVLVLFGGQSSEHIVSCMSAVNVINHIDRSRYEVLIIGITEEGKWLYTEDAAAIQDEAGGREQCRLCFLQMLQSSACSF
mgnify:CR=1 FL=1